MANDDGESDGERCGSVQVGAVTIHGGEDGEDELEGEEELHTDPHACRHAGAEAGHAEPAADSLRCHGVHQPRSRDGTHQLSDDVEHGPQDGDFARQE